MTSTSATCSCRASRPRSWTPGSQARSLAHIAVLTSPTTQRAEHLGRE